VRRVSLWNLRTKFDARAESLLIKAKKARAHAAAHELSAQSAALHGVQSVRSAHEEVFGETSRLQAALHEAVQASAKHAALVAAHGARGALRWTDYHAQRKGLRWGDDLRMGFRALAQQLFPVQGALSSFDAHMFEPGPRKRHEESFRAAAQHAQAARLELVASWEIYGRACMAMVRSPAGFAAALASLNTALAEVAKAYESQGVAVDARLVAVADQVRALTCKLQKGTLIGVVEGRILLANLQNVVANALKNPDQGRLSFTLGLKE
jgi:hypothetical protein